MCVCVCVHPFVNRGKHDLVLCLLNLRFLQDVHVQISNTQLGMRINSLASGMEIKMEGRQHALPLGAMGV